MQQGTAVKAASICQRSVNWFNRSVGQLVNSVCLTFGQQVNQSITMLREREIVDSKKKAVAASTRGISQEMRVLLRKQQTARQAAFAYVIGRAPFTPLHYANGKTKNSPHHKLNETERFRPRLQQQIGAFAYAEGAAKSISSCQRMPAAAAAVAALEALAALAALLCT